MTTNGKGNATNFTDVAYDSGNGTSAGRKRIAISATEIELLDDIPPMGRSNATTSKNHGTNQTHGYDAKIVSSSNGRHIQQNTYQTLSLNNRSTKPNIIYHDENDPQVNSAFDKLIEKYAPDAIPANLLNNSNTHRQPQAPPTASSTAAQINARSTYDETGFPTYQTSSAPTSSTISHDYSTIIRSANNQTTQNPIEINANNFSSSIHSKSTSNYDSFQHVPSQHIQTEQWQSTPKQQAQTQQWQSTPKQQAQHGQFQDSIRIKTKNGNVAQVVPGKLYNLDDDPLHLFFDRQNPIPSKQQQQQQFTSSFQPSINIPTFTNPMAPIYANTTQQFQSQLPPITTNSNFIPNVNGMAPLDLGVLIKRVQQDYLREIQPFVSSVKFVEKDQEYGQNLSDIGFTTSATVEKGFRHQANDILRRSFNQQNRTQPTKRYNNVDNDDDNTYTDSNSETYADDISDLPSLNQHEKIKGKFSKQSTSSMTSVTTNDSEYDDEFHSENTRKKTTVASQATSPPPQRNSAKSQNSSTNSHKNVTQSTISNDDNENVETPTAPLATNIKQARRLPSDDKSSSSSDTHATYSDKESINNKNKTNSVSNSHVTPTPMPKSSSETARTLNNQSNSQGIQRSEDIRPTPPTMRVEQSKTKASDTELSESNSAATDDDDDEPAVYNEQLQTSSANRSDFPSNTLGRGAPAGTPNARTPIGNNPPATTTAARTTADQPGTGNIHFLSADQRTAVNQRSGPPPPTTAGPTQTGSTRFFQTDNDSKSNAKRTLKDVPSTISNKIKSIFRRK